MTIREQMARKEVRAQAAGMQAATMDLEAVLDRSAEQIRLAVEAAKDAVSRYNDAVTATRQVVDRQVAAMREEQDPAHEVWASLRMDRLVLAVGDFLLVGEANAAEALEPFLPQEFL